MKRKKRKERKNQLDRNRENCKDRIRSAKTDLIKDDFVV